MRRADKVDTRETPLAEGDVTVIFDADEWSALVAAVEIAFDDIGAIPEGMAEAAGRLWAGTHQTFNPTSNAEEA